VSSDPTKEREFAVEVVRQLRDASFTAYWAGGCVRDSLLGRQPVDYDVATNAKPAEIQEVFKRRKTLAIGAAFGVITVLGPRDAGQIEIATFRQDLGYSDGRHPDKVAFSSAEEDARRRDFTINGMFFDPVADQIIDYVGGRADLEKKLIRAIGNPHERFNEDKLRMLRAIRFAAVLGFAIDEGTLDAIGAMSQEINAVSAERIAGEMHSMLTHASRARAVEYLDKTGTLGAILPADIYSPPTPTSPGTSRVLSMLRALESPSFSLAIATLLFDAPADRVASEVGHRWKLSRQEIDGVDWLSKHRQALAGARTRPWSTIQPLLIDEGADDLVEFHRVQSAVGLPVAIDDVEFCRKKLAEPADSLNPPQLVDGADLIKLGIRPGPVFAKLIQETRDAQLDGKLTSKSEALGFVSERLQSDPPAKPGP
jgi:poly(A) polymerase